MKPQMDKHPLLPAYRKMLDLHTFVGVSANDVIQSSQTSTGNLSPLFWRRVIVRNFAAHVEGLVYLMKMLCLDLQPVMVFTFTNKERDRLQEFSEKRNDKGKVVQKRLLCGFLENFEFTYDCFARVNHSAFKLTFNGGYDCFREMVEIRNRLMHPKSAADLEVSDSEITNVKQAWDWHQQQTLLLLQDTLTAFQQYEKRVAAKL